MALSLPGRSGDANGEKRLSHLGLFSGGPHRHDRSRRYAYPSRLGLWHAARHLEL